MRIDHPTDRPNFAIVYLSGIDLAFSYKTLVGVRLVAVSGFKWLVAENTWGPTTGKHLNYLDHGDKAARVPQSDIEKVASDAMTGYGLADLVAARDLAVAELRKL